jgi:8-oxo-dGTP pyrophosphatase MutT (NUDIX family)
MKILGYFNDDQFPQADFSHTRFTARAIVVDHDRFAFLPIRGEDDFGIRDHIETIGGGIEDGESAQETVLRECMEEAGLEVEIMEFLGVIIDHYHLIHRQTVSYFFLVSVKNDHKKHQRTEMEKSLMDEVLWLNKDEALEMLDREVGKIGKLIQRRDKAAFLEACRVLSV